MFNYQQVSSYIKNYYDKIHKIQYVTIKTLYLYKIYTLTYNYQKLLLINLF